MTVIEWDKVGDRIYQTGIDRGVLYLKDGTAVPWNGLKSVEDGTNPETKSYYLDGVKILDHVTPGEFTGKMTAITYPDEFDDVLGAVDVGSGLTYYEQPAKSFNLSYRTLKGSDIDQDYGYKVHLLYNLMATPESQTFATIGDKVDPQEFSWSLTGTPPIGTIDGMRPTVHISVDSNGPRPDLLAQLEDILYGTSSTEPRFPTILEVRIMFGEVGGLFIVDNGNGTWTAIDPSDDFIDMLDAETFQISHANATFTDPPDNDTYTIQDTPLPLP
jgi:hypothetical protein